MTVIGEKEGKVSVEKQAEKPAEKQAEKPVEKQAEPKDKENVFDSLDNESKVDTESDGQKGVKEASSTPGVRDMPGKGVLHGDVHTEKYDASEVVITPEEKSAFIDAVVTGDRYRQSFDIFGGHVHIVVRSRTSDETAAMYAYMRHEMSKKDANTVQMETDMQYLLLLTQVEEVNGTKFSELKAPYMFKAKGDSEEAPAWMEDMLAWKSKPEGLVGALVNRVQLFEYKYWTMVREAANKNFWSSGASTAE